MKDWCLGFRGLELGYRVFYLSKVNFKSIPEVSEQITHALLRCLDDFGDTSALFLRQKGITTAEGGGADFAL